MAKRTKHIPDEPDEYLDGQLLIAMPTMQDKRFRKTVIYMCAHSEEGAMGLIINQRADGIEFPELARQLSIVEAEDGEAAGGQDIDMPVHIGGPVETGRGFVLHSRDYFSEESTLDIAEGFGLTATIDILKAIAAGQGPKHAILALGYSGWAPGQLEAEIQANGWLHCPADSALVFDTDIDTKYERALGKLGIDLSHFVSAAGRA